jgi:hypothetical protein
MSSAFNWSRIDPDSGFCEYCDETLSSDRDNGEVTNLITVNFFTNMLVLYIRAYVRLFFYYRNYSLI